jgi:hypothetical protein
MSKQTTLTITATVTGDGESLNYTPPGSPIINNACPQGGPISQFLTFGDTTISFFTGTAGVIIVPPTTSTVVKKIKGATSDSGIAIAPNMPTVLTFSITQGPFVINAQGTETVMLMYF